MRRTHHPPTYTPQSAPLFPRNFFRHQWIFGGMLALATACLPPESVILDEDADGFRSPLLGGDDCDDTNPAIHPQAVESCDGLDNNCNEAIDEPFPDTDGNGTPDCASPELCDGLDNDGDQRTDEGFSDADRDGLADCVDVETCDLLDNDGDGLVDEEQDADGLGGPDCVDNDLDGFSEAAGDCQDESPLAAPSVEWERLDGIDNTCSRGVDEGQNLSQASRGWRGINADSEAGFNLIVAGDMDGDQQPEVLITARREACAAGAECGAIYWVSGATLPGRGVSLQDAQAVFRGAAAGEHLGESLAALGDFNGDGLADVAIGAADGDFGKFGDAGKVYLLLGRPGGYEGELVLEEEAVAMIVGRGTGDRLGQSLLGPGDLTGDGYPDLVVSAPSVDLVSTGETQYNVGELYLFAGGPSGLSGTIATSAARLTYQGVLESNCLGFALASAGDLDNDGLPELLVGEPDPSSPRVYLLKSQAEARGVIRLDGSQGAPQATYSSDTTGERLGVMVAGLTDFNGDGHPDIVMSATRATGGGTQVSGQVYLFLGSAIPPTGKLTVASADWFISDVVDNELGQGLADVGDLNGDGLSDLVIAEPILKPLGITYHVLLGRARLEGSSPKIASVTSATFEDSVLFRSYALHRVSIAGMDLDDDGKSELLLGVPRSNSKDDPGNVYVYPGY